MSARPPKTPPGITPVWRERTGSWSYKVRYRAPNGTSRAATFPSLAKAKQYLSGSTTDRYRGDWLDPQKGRRTFGEWADEWLETLEHLKPATRERYRVALDAHVCPELGDMPVGAIDAAEIRKFLSHTRARYARGTVHNARTALSGVLGFAADAGAIRYNPARGAKIGKATHREQVFLTLAQVDDLAHEIEHPPTKKHGAHRAETFPTFGLIVRFAAYTGLRSGEIWALKVRNVDLLRRRIHVVESVADTAGHITVGPPKNGRRRDVAIAPQIADELGRHLKGRARDDLVFANTNGEHVRHGHWYTDHFAPAVKRAGLPVGTVFHSLRHTCAATLADAGVTELDVMAHLGHQQPVATYRHLFPDRGNERIAEAFARVDAPEKIARASVSRPNFSSRSKRKRAQGL